MASGWLECCFQPSAVTRGRGYFSTQVAPKSAAV
jgi:hypothetical protein